MSQCKGCNHRTEDCHTYCKDYLEFRDKVIIARKKKKQDILPNCYFKEQRLNQARYWNNRTWKR